MFSFFTRLKENYATLRRAVNAIGEEFETKTIDELNQFLDNEHAASGFKREFEGIELSFDFQEWGPDKETGCPGYNLNVYGLPTILGVKPGYHFYKRSDESVFY